MRCSSWSLLVFAALVCGVAGDDPSPPQLAPREALQKLNVLIGEWRGIGQPRRQSNKDAWNETAAWVWDLEGEAPALVQTVSNGKLIQAVRCEYDPATVQYVLTATAPDGTQRVFRGGWQNEQLVLVSPGETGAVSQRITLTPRSDIRVIALHEATEPGKPVYFRVAEIGYTRAGKRLAGPGGGQPQCVVTGGYGDIPVLYNGETYYVCCTGCKQAFEKDPARILKEYRERLEKEKAAAAAP